VLVVSLNPPQEFLKRGRVHPEGFGDFFLHRNPCNDNDLTTASRHNADKMSTICLHLGSAWRIFLVMAMVETSERQDRELEKLAPDYMQGPKKASQRVQWALDQFIEEATSKHKPEPASSGK